MRSFTGVHGGRVFGDNDVSLPRSAPGPSRLVTPEDRRRRAEATKTRLKRLLAECDEFLERERLRDADVSTRENDQALARLLKARHG